MTGLIRRAATQRSNNLLINGDFAIQQRSAADAKGYLVDRWISKPGTGGTPSLSIGRQNLSLGTISGNPPFRYSHTQVAPATATQPRLLQLIEGVRTLAGQTATLSFWAKAGSNHALQVAFRQHFGTGGSPSADVDTAVQTVALSNTWQWFALQFAIPSVAGKTIGSSGTDHLGLRFLMPLNTTFTIEFADVRLEPGIIANPFERIPAAIELQRCAWFYQIAETSFLGASVIGGRSRVAIIPSFPMRTTPTALFVSNGQASFPSSPSESFIYLLPGNQVRLVDDRTASASNGYFSSMVYLDAELAES